MQNVRGFKLMYWPELAFKPTGVASTRQSGPCVMPVKSLDSTFRYAVLFNAFPSNNSARFPVPQSLRPVTVVYSVKCLHTSCHGRGLRSRRQWPTIRPPVYAIGLSHPTRLLAHLDGPPGVREAFRYGTSRRRTATHHAGILARSLAHPAEADTKR